MKRYNNLWDTFTSKENWHLAIKSAVKHKKSLYSVQRTLAKGEDYLESLRQQIIDGTFEFLGYNTKMIYEPKPRKLYIARLEERFFHWACMILTEKIFEPTFVSGSYACRKKKGQHRCSIRCMEFVRKNKYCLKLDIRKFYPSLNQDILKNRLASKIKDKRFLNALYQIIDSYAPDGIHRGVPIGNYSSQIFGNIYMTPLDYFVKQDLHCKAYLRYCDDFCLFSNDKKYLNECKRRIIDFVHNKLDMELSKCDLFPVSRGVDFVGYRHFPRYILVRKRTAKRIKRRLKQIPYLVEHGKLTNDQALGKIASAYGWAKHANSYHFLQTTHLLELKERYTCKNSRISQKKSADTTTQK